MKRARWNERKSMPHPLQVYINSPEELSVYSQNYDVIEKKAVIIGSRLWERGKKNAEYYVGDYYKTSPVPVSSDSSWNSWNCA